MNTFKKLLVVGMLASTALVAGQAMATIDLTPPSGEGIATSAASIGVGVGVTIPQLLNELGELSFQFDPYIGTGTLSKTEDLTVGMNYVNTSGISLYTITATSDNSATGKWYVVNQADATIPGINFSITADDRVGGKAVLVAGTASADFAGYNSLALGGKTPNLFMTYLFSEEALQGAMAGEYATYVNFSFDAAPDSLM